MSTRIERTGDGIVFREFDAGHGNPRGACPCGCGQRDLAAELAGGVAVTCLRCYTDTRDPPGWRIGSPRSPLAALAASEADRRDRASAEWEKWLADAAAELAAAGDPCDTNRRETRAVRAARRDGRP
jgi:hypothetical protein